MKELTKTSDASFCLLDNIQESCAIHDCVQITNEQCGAQGPTSSIEICNPSHGFKFWLLLGPLFPHQLDRYHCRAYLTGLSRATEDRRQWKNFLFEVIKCKGSLSKERTLIKHNLAKRVKL